MYWISEPFLYVGYALLAGMSLFALVPNTMKPRINYPAWLGPAASAIVAASAFIPILQIIMFFKEDIGFYQSFKAVMFNFKEGERYAWIVALSLLAAVLSVLVRRRLRRLSAGCFHSLFWELPRPCLHLTTQLPYSE
ncbi:hypothetical protein [Paenibacillus sp. DMB20]|uniref:hypothetical protein n=1 Tax=Paenibacillus sp. DMB20 TaxID=1642570 RepID=UPI000A794D92|nr:hypothetical protein [Paenibacillus sp. DMB20]